MMSLNQACDMAPNLGNLCNSIVLTIAFGSGFALFLQYWIPAFGMMNSSTILGLILPLLEKYVNHVTEVLRQAISQLSVDTIPDLPIDNVIVALQYLAPFIEMFELLFDLIKTLVTFLERVDSPFFPMVERIWEDLRDVGNPIMEIYRALEAAAGIGPEHSRFAEAWFEN